MRVVEGRLLPKQPRRRKTDVAEVSASSEPEHHSLWSWPVENYKAGFVGGLLIFDAVALCLYAVDVLRFVSRGLALDSAWRMAKESISKGESIASAIWVFAFFAVVVPFVVGLAMRTFRSLNESRKQSAKGAKSQTTPKKADALAKSSFLGINFKSVAILHIGFALTIPVLTVIAQSMQTLCGWQNEANSYSFTSLWAGAVAWINWLNSGIFVPVFLKFLARFFGHEQPHVGEVFKEVGTEFPADLLK